jgi:hypothetical protein
LGPGGAGGGGSVPGAAVGAGGAGNAVGAVGAGGRGGAPVGSDSASLDGDCERLGGGGGGANGSAVDSSTLVGKGCSSGKGGNEEPVANAGGKGRIRPVVCGGKWLVLASRGAATSGGASGAGAKAAG